MTDQDVKPGFYAQNREVFTCLVSRRMRAKCEQPLRGSSGTSNGHLRQLHDGRFQDCLQLLNWTGVSTNAILFISSSGQSESNFTFTAQSPKGRSRTATTVPFIFTSFVESLDG